MESNSNPKNTGKSQSESVGKENGVASYSSSSSFESLKKGEDRASYLTRKGLAAILEYEKRKDKDQLTSQEKTVLSEQLGRLQQETNEHVEIVVNYLTATPPDGSNTSVETGISVRQVESSLKWLEEINPYLGDHLRQELFFNHKDRYNRDMLETEGTDSKGFMGEKGENQVSQEQYAIVPEQSPLMAANRGLGFSDFVLGGLLVFYVVNKIYRLVYKPKNKNKDV
jgi:hypothetical protein